MFKEVSIDMKGTTVQGHLMSQGSCRSWVIFAHGSGSSRLSTRNNWVAKKLNEQGHGTLLFDLLSQDEDRVYENRFNISLLAERLLTVTKWLRESPDYHHEPIAYFGASTGAAAALVAAARAQASSHLFTVISRGGRPDMAGNELTKIHLPVLLLVGEFDYEVIKLNQIAKAQLHDAELTLVPDATHLFEEAGALDQVVTLSTQWLDKHLSHQLEGTL